MGYGEFYTFVKADNAAEAFRKAKKAAIKKYKDDKHSCSASQKEDFKEYPNDIGEIYSLCKTALTNLSAKESTAPTRDESFELRDKRMELKNEKSHFRTRPKRTGKDKAIAIAHLIIEMDEISAPDKPAGVIQALKNEWLVFGIANE